ncbi:hypothetical protein Pcinc_006199 [Petrolisthes cinctipes]|uniref:Uncharacterized protein n=1 Tax=Petrolisthes cinctipes TaxID=88211 RepID=A0AAE1GDN3_PETCI|nr:hypothetical protein Pcinc_006199 [Petrolisthes cinctipes]
MTNSTNGGVKGASRGQRTPMEDQGGTLNRGAESSFIRGLYEPSLFVVHCVHPSFLPSIHPSIYSNSTSISYYFL